MEVNSKKILKEISKLYGVSEADIPKTILRFKKEIDDMEQEIYAGNKH